MTTEKQNINTVCRRKKHVFFTTTTFSTVFPCSFFFSFFYHNNLANHAPALSNKTPSLQFAQKIHTSRTEKKPFEYNLELGDVDAGGGGGVEDAGPLGVRGFAVRFELARFLCVLAAALFVQLDVHLHVPTKKNMQS